MCNSSELKDSLDGIRPFFLPFILWSDGPFQLFSLYAFSPHHFNIQIQEQGVLVTPRPAIEISAEAL